MQCNRSIDLTRSSWQVLALVNVDGAAELCLLQLPVWHLRLARAAVVISVAISGACSIDLQLAANLLLAFVSLA